MRGKFRRLCISLVRIAEGRLIGACGGYSLCACEQGQFTGGGLAGGEWAGKFRELGLKGPLSFTGRGLRYILVPCRGA